MTLVNEGNLGGRDFAVTRDDGGAPIAFVCLGCHQEFPMDQMDDGSAVEALSKHECGKAAPRAAGRAATKPKLEETA
ncbi:hypothetical protein [Longimicrobium sp.]|uniref:hypothetical protein n=1 Tax=Longimicrobium sp. TaxID=2029185 RepID=UPI002ED90A81